MPDRARILARTGLRIGASLLAALLSPGVTTAAELRLSAADCARVVAHLPEPSVAFRPGVDAMGRAVAPADLAPPQAVMPPVPWFVLSVDLAERLMLPPGLKGDLPLGVVAVQDGQLLFNGRPLGGENEAGLAAACAGTRPGRH